MKIISKIKLVDLLHKNIIILIIHCKQSDHLNVKPKIGVLYIVRNVKLVLADQEIYVL